MRRVLVDSPLSSGTLSRRTGPARINAGLRKRALANRANSRAARRDDSRRLCVSRFRKRRAIPGGCAVEGRVSVARLFERFRSRRIVASQNLHRYRVSSLQDGRSNDHERASRPHRLPLRMNRLDCKPDVCNNKSMRASHQSISRSHGLSFIAASSAV